MRQQRNRKRLIDREKKQDKRGRQRQHKKGKEQLLNSVGPLMLGAVDRHGEG